MYLMVICLASLLMLVIMFMTDILLDPGTVATIKPYSLSRTQLAFWTLIVFCSFVYVWGSSDQPDGFITGWETVLILLGVSSTVTILGKMIDTADIQKVVRGRRRGRHKDKGRVGFFRDILSDGNGISLYRFQNVLFTALLMIAFIISTARAGEMPDFDKTLLALYGVSSVGYLGAKMNENK